MTVVTRQELGQEAWDAAVDASSEAWFWHRYDVCDLTIRDWPGRTDAGFAVLSDRGEVAAIVPAFILERRTPIGIHVRYLDSMGGPALSAMARSRRQETLDEVAAELKRRGDAASVVRTTISLSSMAPALRGPEGPRCNPLLYMGCDDISGQTWVADLRHGADAAWNRLEGRARRNVRKAEALGVTVRESTSMEEWRVFFELHQATYRRLGVPTYPTALFRAIYERLIPAGLCHIQIAELNGEPIAASSLAYYKQGGYFWHIFSSDEGQRVRALNLLLWNWIKSLAGGAKLQWLDCGDAHVNARDGKMYQISHFKESFGGELYPIFRGQFNGTSKFYNRMLLLKKLIST